MDIPISLSRIIILLRVFGNPRSTFILPTQIPLVWLLFAIGAMEPSFDYSNVDDICNRIRRNDPSLVGETCHIPVLHQNQHHCSLVAALKNSTVVTSLSFDVTPYCDKCDIQPILDYLSKEAKLIQSVSLTEDPNVFNGQQFCTAGQLVRAMIDNDQLALVEFSCRFPLHPRCHILDLLQSKASTLKHLSLSTSYRLGEHDRWSESEMAALAATIGSLSLLRDLTLNLWGDPKMIALVLEELCNHKCLRKLCIGGDALQDKLYRHAVIDVISSVLQSRVLLETLQLKDVVLCPSSMESLVRGLESCHGLVELTLHCHYEIADETSQELLLRFLQAGRSTAACTIRRIYLKACAGTIFPFLSGSILKAAASD
jgi:hypothetical protein